MNRRPFLAIFLVAAAVRLIWDLAVWSIVGPDGLFTPDSHGFMSMAVRIAGEDRVFGFGASAAETTRMPFYFHWLALHVAVFGREAAPLAVVAGQAVIGGLTAVAAARLAGLFDRRLVLPAGLFLALVPTSVVVSGLLLNDTLFTLFATLTLFGGVAWLQRPGSWPMAGLAGLAAGLALLVRAMMLPWAVGQTVLLLLLRWWAGRPTGGDLLRLLVVVLLSAAVVSPILGRNLRAWGTAELTAQTGTFLLFWVVPLVMEAEDGTPHAEGAAEMDRLFRESTDPEILAAGPFARSRAMSVLALDRLAGLGPLAIARAWSFGIAINLAAPATSMVPFLARLPRTGFYDTPGDGNAGKIFNFLFRNDNPVYAWGLLGGAGGVLLLRLMQLYGLGLALRRPEARAGILLLLAWVAVILLVNGPVAGPKYRLPLEPVFAVFFAFAWNDLVARHGRDRGRPERKP